jgi:hypothetical protein
MKAGVRLIASCLLGYYLAYFRGSGNVHGVSVEGDLQIAVNWGPSQLYPEERLHLFSTSPDPPRVLGASICRHSVG